MILDKYIQNENYTININILQLIKYFLNKNITNLLLEKLLKDWIYNINTVTCISEYNTYIEKTIIDIIITELNTYYNLVNSISKNINQINSVITNIKSFSIKTLIKYIYDNDTITIDREETNTFTRFNVCFVFASIHKSFYVLSLFELNYAVYF